MRDLDSADDLEQLAGKMRGGTDTGARIIELVRVGFGTRDEGGDRIDAEPGIDQNRIWRSSEFGNRREILVRIVGNFCVETGVDDVGARRDQQRVAVRLGVCHSADPDIAPRSRLVLNDESTANGIAKMHSENARHGVGRAAGRKGHDDLDRALGIARGPRPGRPEAGRRCRAYHETGGPQNRATRSACWSLMGHGGSPGAESHISNTATARIGEPVPLRHFIGRAIKGNWPWPSSVSRLHRLSMWVMPSSPQAL